MKTFLWTSLFWILVIIAGSICLGFFDLIQPVYAPATSFIAEYTSSDIKGLIVDDFLHSDEFQKSDQFQEILENNCIVPACDCPVMNECPSVNCPVCEAPVETAVQNTPVEVASSMDSEKMNSLMNSFTNVSEMIKKQGETQDTILAKITEISQQITSLKNATEDPATAQRRAEIEAQIAKLQSEYQSL